MTERIEQRIKPLGLGWPNIVSIARALLTPPLVWLILRETRTASYIAAGVFVLGSASDGLDGYLARRHRSVTSTGIWLDPLSDKIFVAVPMIAMSAIGVFPWWATVMIVAREAAVSGLRIYLGSRKTSMPASIVAKAKTATQLLAIALYLLPHPDGARGARFVVLIVAVVLTVYSGLDYFVRVRPGGEDRGSAPPGS